MMPRDILPRATLGQLATLAVMQDGDRRDAQIMRGEVTSGNVAKHDAEWRRAQIRDRAFIGLDR